MSDQDDVPNGESSPSHSWEWLTVFFITFVVLPGLSVGFVGAYGFVVWMLQIIYGPPTGGL